MVPVVQKDPTGCAIASVAAITGISYDDAKSVATRLGISIDDPTLWSENSYIRTMLKELGVQTSTKQETFVSWYDLPNCALLAVKWHTMHGKPYWHWVVFVRKGIEAYVLDSNKSLKSNIRKDFGRMKPNWYIGVRR